MGSRSCSFGVQTLNYNQMYPTDLTDSQWQAIQQTLPLQMRPGGEPQRKRKHSLRLIINAILYVTKGGITWRMMPVNLPNWALVYFYFRKWSADGTVEAIHQQLLPKVRQQAGRNASPSLGLIDSQSVKTMSFTTEKGFDGNKKINGRNRFIITDVLGLVLAISVLPANTGERAGALVVLAQLQQRFSRLKTILADQGFDGVEFVQSVKTQFGLLLEVVCQVLGLKGFVVLPKRWIVERTFGWFGFYRRLAKDYEEKPAHAEAFIYWAMINIMSRRIRETNS
jgi:putative transposase